MVSADDILSKTIGKPLSESVDLIDILTGVGSRFASMVEIVNQSDILGRSAGLFRTMIIGSFTRTGFTLSGFVSVDSVLSFDLAEVSVHITNLFRTINEIGGYTASGFSIDGFLTGGIILSDSIVKEVIGTITEPAITFGVDITSRIINELGNLRFLTESIALTQSIQKDITKTLIELGGFTTGFTLSGFFIGGVEMKDILQFTKDRPIFLNEVVNAPDIVNRLLWQFRYINGVVGTIPVSDSIFMGFGVNLIESITNLDPVNRISESLRFIIEDDVILSEALLNGVTNFAIINDVDVILNDLVSKALGMSVTDTIILGDGVVSVTNILGLIRDLVETTIILDPVARVIDQFRTILDASGFTLSGYTLSGFAFGSLVLSRDVVNRVFDNFGVINETVTFGADITTRVKNILGNLRSLIEIVAQVDSVKGVKAFLREILQVPAFVQTGFTDSGFLRNSGVLIQDVISILESQDLFREISESSGFSITGFTEGFYINGGVFIGDIVGRLAELTRINTNTISLSDTMQMG